jgi:hypothetical protein
MARAPKSTFKRREHEHEHVTTPSLERHQWVELAAAALRQRFTDAGYTVPVKVRVSIGWPKRAASCGAVGECWSPEASSDNHAELFVSPVMTDGLGIVHVLAHELVHATVGTSAGHGRAFKQCALRVGLVGPMRATTAGPELTEWIAALIERIGPYPAGFLTDMPKQGTRMLRCECEDCGYLARVTQKWLIKSGPPICPNDLVQMALKEADKPTA